MKLFIVNETLNEITYLGGIISIAASSTFEVTNKSHQIELALDGKFRKDLIQNIATLSDGFNTFSSTDALAYLTRIELNSLAASTNTNKTITAVGQSTTLYFDVASSATIEVSGTWEGTLSVRASLDGVNFNTIVGLFPVPSGNVITAITANGTWIVPVGGYRALQITSSSWVSGSANIIINSSLGTNSNAGTNTANQGAPNIYGNAWPMSMGQQLDTNNSITITSANASPGSPWVGVWTKTRDEAFVRELVLIASNVTSGLGGILTFEFSEDGTTVAATNPRQILSFSSVRDFDLLNTGAYFRIKFEPDRTMTVGESVFIRSTLRRQNDGPFARLLSQELEEFNASLPHNATFLKAFDARTRKSVNIRSTTSEALRVSNEKSFQTPSGSQFVESIRDDVSHKFSSSRLDVEFSKLKELVLTGSSTHIKDYSQGQLVLSTGVTPNSAIAYGSKKFLRYETAHGIRIDQSIEIKSVLTGDSLVMWGISSDDLTNGAGIGVDSVGVFTWRKKNGVFEHKVYQSSWNRDKCDGAYPSLFKKNGTQVALNVQKDNAYLMQFEWLGADGFSWAIKSPSSESYVVVNVDEYSNSNNGSSLPDPELRMFIYAKNDSISGGDIQVATASWRGGVYTSNSVSLGRNPNDDYNDIRTQGVNDDNSTTIPLPGNTGGSDHIWRGLWFKWSDAYAKLTAVVNSDVPGTLFVDYSSAVFPIDGSDVDLEDSDPVIYDPVVSGMLHVAYPVSSKWVRLRYINGIAAQAFLDINAIFITNDPGLITTDLNILPNINEQAGLVRSIPAVLNATGTAYQHLPIGPEGSPKSYITHIADDVLIEPLNGGLASQIIVGTTPVRLDPTQISNRRVIRFSNEGPTRIAWGHSSSITFNTSSIRMKVNKTEHKMLDNNVQLWAVAEDTGGVQTTLTRLAASASGTATNPSNVLTSNNVYANIAANSQTITTTGYTAGTTNTLVSVKLGVEGNKQSGQTETVQHVDTVTGTAGNIGSVSSGTVISSSANFYIAQISRRNANANVTSVSGLGLTWSEIGDITGDSTQTRISVWKGTGTPTGDGVVVANFSVNATNSVIAVSRFNNVDLSNPVTNISALNDTALSSSYSSSIIGTIKGMLVTSVSMRQRLHTPTSGATEVHETRTGTTTSDASLATNILSLPTTGSQTYSGNFDSTVGWSVVALTLNPKTANDPIINLSYTLSAIPGATSSNISFLSLSDVNSTVDITSDRIWVYTDIVNINVIATGQSISAAAANIDTIYLEITDTTGNTARVSVWQGGKAIT